MKNIIIGFFFLLVLSTGNSLGQTVTKPSTFMIRHTVIFTLKHPQGSPEEKLFIDAAKKLSAIPGVHHFECLRQTSKKNTYEYGLSMEFDSAQAYEDYNKSTAHVAFVEMYWAKNVKEFMEVDYEPYQ
jgi:hypothetical protein